MKRALAPLLLLALSTPASAAAPTLATVAHASQLPYSGELVVNNQVVLRVTHGSGDRRRQEVIAPPTMVGELVVDDGHTRYHYSPRTRKVDITPSAVGLRRSAETERLLKRNFTLVLIAQETLNGRPAYKVELRPRYPNRPLQRMWIEARSGLPLRTERFDAQGRLIETGEFRAITSLSATGSDTFTFAMPPGAQLSNEVQLLESGSGVGAIKTPLPFKVHLPGNLPAGFEVQDVHLIRAKGVSSVHWRISDGLDTISLFQTARGMQPPPPERAQVVSLPAATGYLVERRRERLLCWENDLGTYTLVGDLPAEELLAVAGARRP